MSIKFTILGCGSSLGIPRIDGYYGSCDPKNERKIKNLIRFFKDFWPAIVGAYLLFGTKFGG